MGEPKRPLERPTHRPAPPGIGGEMIDLRKKSTMAKKWAMLKEYGGKR
jgi:hypothetical protein